MSSKNHRAGNVARLFKSSRRRRLAMSSLAAAVAAMPAVVARAATTHTWVSPVNGNWSVSGNWTPSGVPSGSGDTANITSATNTAFTVNYDYLGTAATINVLTVELTGVGSNFATLSFASTLAPALTAGTEFIGNVPSGRGAMIQNTGVNTITTFLEVGVAGQGFYNLGGTGTVSAAGGEYLGVQAAGTGTFTQSGGFNNQTTNGLFVGYQNIGTYILSGGTLSMANGVAENIGYSAGSTGFFSQTNGANNLSSSSLILGNGISSTGSYSLQGGTIGATNSVEDIGLGGSGSFTQTTGTNFLNFNSSLVLGSGLGSSGSYTMQGGVLTLTIGSEFIGGTGAASFTQTGGVNTISNSNAAINLGNAPTSTGTYVLSSNGTITNAGGEFLGVSFGDGIFNQSGGIQTISKGLFVGGSGYGTYLLSGGTLNSTGGEDVGGLGGGALGTFIQTGGINNVSGLAGQSNSAMEIGELMSASSDGAYSLQGGTLNVTGSETVGDDGTARFTQGDGLNSVTGNFFVGSGQQGSAGNSDTYTMTGGTLAVAGYECVGIGAFGSNLAGTYADFEQSGGLNTIGNTLGLNVGGNFYSAFYNLTGGTLVTPNVNVSYTGTFNVSSGMVNSAGGTLTAINPFPVGGGVIPGGAVIFSGGTIKLFSLDLNGAPSDLYWTGGTFNFTQSITLDPGGIFYSTAAAFGSSLMLNAGMGLNVTGNETLGGTSAFTLTLNPGSTDTATGILSTAPNGTLIQNGGPISQSLTNQGTFNYNGGVFSGVLINQGQANLNTSFTAGGINNSGVIEPIPLGETITLTSTGLTNSGLMTLAGGAIVTGAGGINNSSLITGHGSLSGNTIINTGTIDIDAGLALQVSGTNFTNDGVINLGGGNLTGAIALTNNVDGEIMGGGNISVTSFTNNGTLLIPNGTTHIGSFNNNGVIELAGAGGNLGPSGTITNAAIIEGFGKISSAVINNGEIQPTGGTMLITGALSNPVGGLISLAQSDELLAANFASNGGIISLTGGTFDSANNPITNNGQVTGYGVLRSGGFTNTAAMTFTGGTTTVNGAFQNNLLGTVSFKYQPTIFTGNVTNNGLFKTTGTTVTFAGMFTGSVTSDPSTNIFQNNVTTNAGNAITGGSGDQFFMLGGTFNNGGSFINGGLLSSSNPINNSGVFTQTGSLTQSANMTNTGTATIGGAQNWSNGVVYANGAGKSTFLSDSGSQSTSPLNFNVTGGTVAFKASQHVSSVAVSGGGVIDVTNTTLRVNYGAPANDPVASIAGYLSSGYKSGAWTGNGINSSTAAAGGGNPLLSVGYADGNTDIGTSAGANQVVVKYTLAGDSNLDGLVNFNDLVAVVQNFNKSGTDWAHGNFTYAASTNFNDLVAVVQNFNKALTPAGSSDVSGGGTTIALSRSAQIQSTDVQLPEPGAIGLALVAAAGCLGRRSRRARKLDKNPPINTILLP